MASNDLLARVKVLLQNEPGCTDADLSVYLDIAAGAIADRLYPFADDDAERTIPNKYIPLQCELAARYVARAGGLGETSHTENGITRNWGSVNDSDLLSRVVPRAKVVS